jgi:hypothetical protein
MRILAALFLGMTLLALAPPPAAQALSGACAMRCLPQQRACIARYPDRPGFCRARHRACAMRCMGLR